MVTIHPVRSFNPALIHLSYPSMAFSAIKKPHQEISSSLRSSALCNISVLSAWFKIEIDRENMYNSSPVPMFSQILNMRN